MTAGRRMKHETIDRPAARHLLATQQAPQASAAQVQDECELDDMAHAAFEEAMAFGVSVDAFRRPLKSLAKKMTATQLAPVLASASDDAERLDWLERQSKAYGFEDLHEGIVWEVGGAYRSIRDAIDHESAAEERLASPCPGTRNAERGGLEL